MLRLVQPAGTQVALSQQRIGGVGALEQLLSYQAAETWGGFRLQGLLDRGQRLGRFVEMAGGQRQAAQLELGQHIGLITLPLAELAIQLQHALGLPGIHLFEIGQFRDDAFQLLHGDLLPFRGQDQVAGLFPRPVQFLGPRRHLQVRHQFGIEAAGPLEPAQCQGE